MLPQLVTEIPGPLSRALAAELRRYESRNVTYVSPRFPVFWKEARGVNVWDVDGNRFLDLTSGFGVASLGYGNGEIRHAAHAQIDLLSHAMGDVHPTEAKAELCRMLSQLTFEDWGVGPGKSILASSGGEAVEAALKTAFVATGKSGVIAFDGGYHGLGYGPLTVTRQPFFRRRFESQLASFAEFLPFPQRSEERSGSPSAAPLSEDAFGRKLSEAFSANAIGAILFEPIQGRGGVIVPPDWFLPLLRRRADEHGALLIADEIFTGWYRTGPRFGCDTDGVVPDLICLGKALAGGFPLSACVGRAALMDAWPESDGEALHTSTFLGNPLGCAMALASLKELEFHPWTERVRNRETIFRRALQPLTEIGPPWGKVRGRGLMLGLEVIDTAGAPDPRAASRLIEEALAWGLILLSAGMDRNVLSFTPPFTIGEEEISAAVNILGALTESA